VPSPTRCPYKRYSHAVDLTRDDVATLTVVLSPVLAFDVIALEHPRCGLEAQAALSERRVALGRIPLETFIVITSPFTAPPYD